MNEHTNQVQFDCDFGEALRDELPGLRRMARWFAGDATAADDLLQDTLVLALRFQDNFRQGTNLRAWLVRVMRNRHISILRRAKLERKILEAEGKHFVTNWSIGAAGRRTMRRGGDVERDTGLSDPVMSAMDNLRPEFREAVWLCDVEGLSYADAARQIECPVGTIMSRLHRGRRALRQRLGSRQLVEAAA